MGVLAMRVAVTGFICAALLALAACAGEATAPRAQIARVCEHPVSSQVMLAGAVLTTSKCAD
jgi:hypothetical protein